MWQLLFSFVALVVIVSCITWLYRKPYIDQFASKTVFITGTDSGFGLALALNLDKCGVKVYAGCYTKEGAENLKKEASVRLKTVGIDISQMDSVVRAKKAVEQDLEPGDELWGLVNNAGMFPGGAVFALSDTEDYKAAMDVNFFGTMNVTNAFMPLLMKSKGRIVNVISMAGRVSGSIEPYSCSKHALEPYSDGLRQWLRYFGIHVAIIEPGIFRSTNLLDNAVSETSTPRRRGNALRFLPKEHVEKFFEAVEKDVNSQFASQQWVTVNKPAIITNAMKHALFAKHPKDRYVCGWDAKTIYRLATIVPDWTLDLAMRLIHSTIHDTVSNIKA